MTDQEPVLRCKAHAQIDEEHANAKRLWREMDEPGDLSAREGERLRAVARLAQNPLSGTCEGCIQLHLTLSPPAVAIVTVKFTPQRSGAGLTA